MKTVIGIIKQTDNKPNANKKITFALKDRYGKEVAAMSRDGEIVSTQEVTTDENGSFSVKLESLDAFMCEYSYEMSFEGKINPIKLYVYGVLGLEIDYKKCLLKEPNLRMFYELVEQTHEYKFTADMETLFNTFFVGENEFFKQEEMSLVDMFIKNADSKIASEVMIALDNHLATIGV
jgi:hypothetical protein